MSGACHPPRGSRQRAAPTSVFPPHRPGKRPGPPPTYRARPPAPSSFPPGRPLTQHPPRPLQTHIPCTNHTDFTVLIHARYTPPTSSFPVAASLPQFSCPTCTAPVTCPCRHRARTPLPLCGAPTAPVPPPLLLCVVRTSPLYLLNRRFASTPCATSCCLSPYAPNPLGLCVCSSIFVVILYIYLMLCLDGALLCSDLFPQFVLTSTCPESNLCGPQLVSASVCPNPYLCGQ